MKSYVNLLILILFSVLSIIGCTEGNNPLESNEPGGGSSDPEIKQPVYLSLTNIKLIRFASKKPNGDKWDYHIFSDSPTRRPDIYAELFKSGSSNILFKSDTKEDAELKTAYSSYSFNKSGEKNGINLPLKLEVTSKYTIKFYDDDGLSKNDEMTDFEIIVNDQYEKDNADFLYRTFNSGSYTVEIQGRWIY